MVVKRIIQYNMSDIKDNLEGCEICLRHVDVDTLVSMLDRKKFNIVAGGIADGDCGWEVKLECKYAMLTQKPDRLLLLSPKRLYYWVDMSSKSAVSIRESEIKCITVDDQWIHVKTTTFEFHICMGG